MAVAGGGMSQTIVVQKIIDPEEQKGEIEQVMMENEATLAQAKGRKRCSGSKNLRPLKKVQRKDFCSSGRGTRTPDPWIMIPLLYQLSYAAT